MDMQTLINIGGAALMAIIGWLGRQLWDAVSDLRKDIRKIEVDLPTSYVRRDEMKEEFREIRKILSEIFMKIDQLRDLKADK
jgi:hypothetical protein